MLRYAEDAAWVIQPFRISRTVQAPLSNVGHVLTGLKADTVYATLVQIQAVNARIGSLVPGPRLRHERRQLIQMTRVLLGIPPHVGLRAVLHRPRSTAELYPKTGWKLVTRI